MQRRSTENLRLFHHNSFLELKLIEEPGRALVQQLFGQLLTLLVQLTIQTVESGLNQLGRGVRIVKVLLKHDDPGLLCGAGPQLSLRDLFVGNELFNTLSHRFHRHCSLVGDQSIPVLFYLQIACRVKVLFRRPRHEDHRVRHFVERSVLLNCLDAIFLHFPDLGL